MRDETKGEQTVVQIVRTAKGLTASQLLCSTSELGSREYFAAELKGGSHPIQLAERSIALAGDALDRNKPFVESNNW